MFKDRKETESQSVLWRSAYVTLHLTTLLAFHTLQCRTASLGWFQQRPGKVSSDEADPAAPVHIRRGCCYPEVAAAPDTHSVPRLTSHPHDEIVTYRTRFLGQVT